MKYNLFIPAEPIVKESIQVFWQTDGNNNFHNETIIPKGIIELMFNFCDLSDYTVGVDGINYQLSRCVITGFNTVPLHIRLPKHQSTFGVVFYPAAIQALFYLPAGELLNQCVDMTLIDASISNLWHRLAEQSDFNHRVRVFSDWLKQRPSNLNQKEQAFNAYLSMGSNSLLSVSELANQFSYSGRHLSRKLQQLTGMNSEQTLMYKKYIRSIFLMHQSNLSLTEIGYDCDFSDQSHFIKTFKTFTFLTPSEYKKRKSQIIGHFYDDVR